MKFRSVSPFYYLLLVFLLWGCDQHITAKQYFAYLGNAENGLNKIQKTKWFEYEMQYQTADALALRTLGVKSINQDNFLKAKQIFLGHRYFVVSIKPNKSTQNVQEALMEATRNQSQADHFFQILQFGLQPYVKLCSGTDTIPCALYHAEPPLFKNGALQINLVFVEESRFQQKQDLALNIRIPDFPDDIPTFRIKRSDLTQIPTLKF